MNTKIQQFPILLFFLIFPIFCLSSCNSSITENFKTPAPSISKTNPPSNTLNTNNNSESIDIKETEGALSNNQASNSQEPPPNFEETQESIENNPFLTIPENFNFPLSTITIFNPGDLSRVTSPFKVVAEIPKSLENRAFVELFGEDGRLLDREIIYNFGLSGFYDLTISAEMEFETITLAETGLLKITLLDDFGNPLSISSVHLILLREGNSEIAGYGDLRENLIIERPQEDFEAENGNIFVSGYVRAQDLGSLKIKIVNENGETLREAEGVLLETKNSAYSLFLGSLEYFVASPLDVQLVVEAMGEKIPEITSLSSRRITLEP